ncbi:UNVERIFIED_CONTAM: hypothetical protein Scaly_2436000 [Sesamum calycinum]|uniref:Retrotransposon gag domain-containing protein n=1 Tax=Sesamum calycinum TaxID=2727403 RepID=A0AAW2LZW9_9LAMI
MPSHEQAPLNGQALPSHEQALTPPYEQDPLNGQVLPPHEQTPTPPHVESPPPGAPPQETMIQLTQEALFALIRDAFTRPLAVAPPRRSPFSPSIFAESLPTSVKVPNLSEYDRTWDPQEHSDKFYIKIDWYDLSDAAYCKVFRTTLSKCALAWLNYLPTGTIFSLEQLTQHFVHHFSMNKRVPKMAAFLFTIRQKENELLRGYMQRFVEAVHEVSHVDHELFASIIQQNLLPKRFKESIVGKSPSTTKTCSCDHKNTLGLRSRMLRTFLLAARGKVGKRKENRKRRRSANIYLRRGSRTIPH